MWTRKELKQKGKTALSRNYWKAVLVSLILFVIGGGSASTALVNGGSGRQDEAVDHAAIQAEADDGTIIESEILGDGEDSSQFVTAGRIAVEVGDKVEGEISEALEAIEQAGPALAVAFVVVVLVFMTVIFVFAALMDALLLNPLCIGAQRFMLKSVDGMGNVSELGYTFDHNYKNGVKTTFIRDLQIFLWALLLIIPGIYKKYQYYMVDYILAENPDMPYKEVLECSKKLMDGQKWDAFVLDISFILWHMLGALTCGLTEVFYTKPYQYLTRASLYRAVSAQGQKLIMEGE